ncbi:aminotransferase class I/II-fold pyridoxal phosphate-dependent enzyme [Mollicutes bacterium LVI A0078]|nr:aminotransferase class I/II-fold pyridoxal phosphate-dependent enzyme [Mollicutes bacterium LVI A0075]WOO90221.1 aminotransferase class I/II-fold pyridoxal phosphate-dependent enzyme [Mollicutes bacterium LVI A0078]
MKYDFDRLTDRRGTYCTQWDYTADRFGSDDVLPFSISDMDFPLPEDAVKYLQEQLTDGIYGYTRWRNELLLGAIVDWYSRRFNYEVDSKTVMYSPTVIYSLSEIMRMKTKQNPSVFMFTPSYDAFYKVVEENKCQLFTSELIRENDQYTINKAEFEAEVSKCSVIVLCSPHNPIGKFWTKEELEYIVSVCKKHNVYIISDEIHMDISFGASHYPLLAVTKEYDYSYNGCIITSATKAFNFPGLLFSYAIIENEQDRTEFELCLKNKNGLSSCTILGMKATAYVYNNLEQWLDQLNQYVYQNYLYVTKFIQEQKLDMAVTKQDGTYLLWIDSSNYDIDQLLDIMYNQTKVGIMSGEVYGVKGYLRINIGCQRSKLEEGMKRLAQAVAIYKEQNEK